MRFSRFELQVRMDYKMLYVTNPRHPTAQTTYGRDMKFGMESQWGNTFWAIRGFFQFPPLSRDMGVMRGSVDVV